MKKSLILLLFLVAKFQASSQVWMTDSVLVYDIASNTKAALAPVQIPPPFLAQHTGFSYGTWPGAQTLPASVPQTNLIPNTLFTKITKASSTFNVQQFPARTAVKIVHYKGGVSGSLSGMLVGECFVLTSAHIIFGANASPISNFSFDSIKVLPAFDNGTLPPGFSSAWVEKLYFQQKYLTGLYSLGDIALLKINQPLGRLLGYTGIGFFSDSITTKTKLFHKFSYPAGYDPVNPVMLHNGDTMFYNYGKITYQNSWYALQGGSAIPGQSGSTFLYFDGTDYYNVGTLSYSSNYLHFRILIQDYYALKSVLDSQSCAEGTLGMSENESNHQAVQISPNPSAGGFNIKLSKPAVTALTFMLYDATGKLILSHSCSDAGFFLPRTNLASGLYSLVVKEGDGTTQIHKLIVE